ncbi:hypothetical protein BDZ97DRAFT_1761634 [Flammula alnicola]|nr:hypothetical protein BDZ97DRAFT_1761634 [Flammula alnicola]
MPLVEIISFGTSDKRVLEDVKKGNSSLSYISKSEGCLRVMQGYALEDDQRAYIIIIWETYGCYRKSAIKEKYFSFITYLQDIPVSGLSIRHFEVDANPLNALSAPITEIVMLKSRKADLCWEEDLNTAVSGIKKDLYLVKGGHPPVLWGGIKEVPGSYFMIIGWDSVEAHLQASKELPLQKYVKKILEITRIEPKHITFRSLDERGRSASGNVGRPRVYSPM